MMQPSTHMEGQPVDQLSSREVHVLPVLPTPTAAHAAAHAPAAGALWVPPAGAHNAGASAAVSGIGGIPCIGINKHAKLKQQACPSAVCMSCLTQGACLAFVRVNQVVCFKKQPPHLLK